MPTYDNQRIVSYTYTGLPAATAGVARAIRRPVGTRFCRVADWMGTPTVAISNTTSAPRIQLGDSATPAKFFSGRVGTDGAGLALAASYGDRDHTTARVTAYAPYIDMDTAGPASAAIDEIEVSFTAGVGTPTGTWDAVITLEWW